MATLQDAIAQVQVYVDALSGVRAAPAYPPDRMDLFPFAVAYSGGGVWEFGAVGVKRGLHIIICELHVARKDLARDVQAAMVYSDSIPNTLLNNPTLAGTVATFKQITYTFGSLGWMGADTIGFRFSLEDVKMESTIT